MSKAKVKWSSLGDTSSKAIPGMTFTDVVCRKKKPSIVIKLYIPAKKVHTVPVQTESPKKGGRFTVTTVPVTNKPPKKGS